MKKQILYTTLGSLTLMVFFGVGCAKKNDSAPPEPPPVVAPPSPYDNRHSTSGMNYQNGDTVDFAPDSLQLVTAYLGNTHPLNQPDRFKINVNISDIGSGRYGGIVQMSYFDNSQYYNGVFDTGSGTVQTSYRRMDNDKPTAEYNQWFTWEGQKVFHGFFQDQYGAVILVIDGSISLGDGGLPSEVNGSLWFKNFAPTYAQASAEKCWFIRTGPYDCRAFFSGGDASVDTTSGLYPADGYRRLGTFKGLKVKKAFNIQ